MLSVGSGAAVDAVLLSFTAAVDWAICSFPIAYSISPLNHLLLSITMHLHTFSSFSPPRDLNSCVADLLTYAAPSLVLSFV